VASSLPLGLNATARTSPVLLVSGVPMGGRWWGPTVARSRPRWQQPPSVDEAVELVVAVAAGQMELGKLADCLGAWARQREPR
jgi:hypothetical protein